MSNSLSYTAPTSSLRQSAAPVRLTPRGRLVLGLGCVFVLMAGWLTLGSGTADAAPESTGSATHSVVVQPGETLWSLAASVAPQSDPREFILRVREMNAIGTDHVFPGQTLIIPAN